MKRENKEKMVLDMVEKDELYRLQYIPGRQPECRRATIKRIDDSDFYFAAERKRFLQKRSRSGARVALRLLVFANASGFHLSLP